MVRVFITYIVHTAHLRLGQREVSVTYISTKKRRRRKAGEHCHTSI